jgi:hypothetical protein
LAEAFQNPFLKEWIELSWSTQFIALLFTLRNNKICQSRRFEPQNERLNKGVKNQTTLRTEGLIKNVSHEVEKAIEIAVDNQDFDQNNISK